MKKIKLLYRSEGKDKWEPFNHKTYYKQDLNHNKLVSEIPYF